LLAPDDGQARHAKRGMTGFGLGWFQETSKNLADRHCLVHNGAGGPPRIAA